MNSTGFEPRQRTVFSGGNGRPPPKTNGESGSSSGLFKPFTVPSAGVLVDRTATWLNVRTWHNNNTSVFARDMNDHAKKYYNNSGVPAGIPSSTASSQVGHVVWNNENINHGSTTSLSHVHSTSWLNRHARSLSTYWRQSPERNILFNNITSSNK